MTPTRRKSLGGATIGVMCSSATSRDRVRDAIHVCGGHAIIVDQLGTVEGATRKLRAAALILDINHHECDLAIDTAAAGDVPVIACTWVAPPERIVELLRDRGIDLLVRPDPDTLCRVLVGAIG